jgi:hypothetical protein
MLWVTTERRLDEVTARQVSKKAKYRLRDAHIKAIEAIFILLTGFFRNKSEPINVFAKELAGITAVPKMCSLNMAQALATGNPYDSETGRDAGLKSAAIMPQRRAELLGLDKGATITLADFNRTKDPAKFETDNKHVSLTIPLSR